MSNQSTKSIPCPYCQLPERDQHSIKRSGQCDGIKNKHLTLVSAQPFRVVVNNAEKNP